MPRKSKEEMEREKEETRVRELRKGPDLDQYLEGSDRMYVSYAEGARRYSMNYYSFVSLAKAAGANIRIKKKAVIDLAILEAYIDTLEEGEGGAANA